MERAKEAFQFQIDLVKAGKKTTTPAFYKLFQDWILDKQVLSMIKRGDEEQCIEAFIHCKRLLS